MCMHKTLGQKSILLFVCVDFLFCWFEGLLSGFVPKKGRQNSMNSFHCRVYLKRSIGSLTYGMYGHEGVKVICEAGITPGG